MIGIQFGVYEFMKKVVLANNANLSEDYIRTHMSDDTESKILSLESVVMEVAADDEQPFPVPIFSPKKLLNGKREKKKKKSLVRAKH